MAGLLVTAGGDDLTKAAVDEIWVCSNADCEPYRYDPRRGDPAPMIRPHQPIPPGTPFAQLPEDWGCPVCGAPKDPFERDLSVARDGLRPPRPRPSNR